MKKILFIISAFLMVSCDGDFFKIIDVDLGRGPDELVVYSIIGPEYNMYVDLYETKTVQTSEFHAPLSGAEIFLYQNNAILDTLTLFQGRYWSKYRPNPENEYRFEINYNSKKIDFTTVLPQRIAFSDVTISADFFVIEEFNYQYYEAEINISFVDPADKNWYLIHIEYSENGEEDRFYSSSLSTSDAAVRQEESSGGFLLDESNEIRINSPFFLGDALFNGTEKNLTLRTNYAPGTYYRISLYHVSENVYLFYKEMEAQRQSLDNPFSEPIDLDGYIDGGRGLTGAWQKSTVTRRVDLDVE